MINIGENMNFIQKRIQQKKIEQEEQLKKEYSYYMIRVERWMSLIKEDIFDLVDACKNIEPEPIEEFISHLQRLEYYYSQFLRDLKKEEFIYKEPYFKNVKEESMQKVEFMQKMKKQYRVEFEKIYDTFKRVTKGTNFPRRNEILGLMRKAFDFDSSKYYSNDDQFVLMR